MKTTPSLLPRWPWLAALLLLGVLPGGQRAQAQGLTRLEYFYDLDPGYGLGTQVVFAGAAATQNATYTASLGGLTPGFHTLYTRVLEQRPAQVNPMGPLGPFGAAAAAGEPNSLPARKVWSIANVRPVYVGPVGTGLANLTYLEYYFDTDPGYRLGYGVALTTPGPSITQTYVADLSSLAPGFHTMYTRVKNAAGAWSIANVRPVYVGPTGAGSTVPNLTYAEYYIDTDPGYRLGTRVNFATPGPGINQNFVADLSGVSNGFHTLFVRVRNAAGAWSISTLKPFVRSGISPTAAPANLTRCEYYIDTDPGHGLATNVPITAGTGLNQTFTADLSGVPNGIHTLYVRVRDASRAWSIVTVRPFVRQGSIAGAARPLITQFRYQVFASGAATASSPPEYYVLPVPARAADVDVTFPTNVCVTTAGNYVLRVAALDANGVPAIEYAHPFAVTTPSQFNPNLPPTLAGCSGQPLTVTSAPAGPGGSYQWSRNGLPLTGATNQALTVTTAATYAVTVTSAAGCSGAGSTSVTFSPAPTIALAPFTNVPCGQTSTVLDAGAGYATYAWTPGGATTQTLTATAPGTYSVTVTGASTGTCTATASTTVRMPKADILQTNTAQCPGVSTTLTLATPVQGSIAWLANGTAIPGQTSPSLSVAPTATTTYTAVVSDGSFSCSAALTITVVPPVAVTLAAQPSVYLSASPFALTGGLPAGGTYSGPGVSGGGTFSPLVAGPGTHAIAYTVGSACPASATRPLTVIDDTTLAVYNNLQNQCLLSDAAQSTGSGLWQRLKLGGKTVAAFNDQGHVLGTVRVEFSVMSGPTRQDYRGTKYLDRNWHLIAQNPLGTGNSAKVRFYGLTTEFNKLSADDPANVPTPASLRLTQYSGPNEDCLLANNAAAGTSNRLLTPVVTSYASPPYFVAQATVTDHFSEFYLNGGSRPLPVELTQFGATRQGRAVLAAWATASERNSAWFAVERSFGGQQFAEIGRVAAQGTTTAPTSYTFLDDKLPAAATPQLAYYRLRQVDQDGSRRYSAVAAVRLPAAASALTLQAAPNPFHQHELEARIEGAEAAEGTLQLLDLAGHVLVVRPVLLPAHRSTVALPELARLPAGVYVLALRVGGVLRQQKVVKE